MAAPPAHNEPIASKVPVDQSLEASSTTEPDTESDTEPHRLLVRHRPAQYKREAHTTAA